MKKKDITIKQIGRRNMGEEKAKHGGRSQGYKGGKYQKLIIYVGDSKRSTIYRLIPFLLF